MNNGPITLIEEYLYRINLQGTNVAHNIMGGLQIIAMFHL